MNSCKKCGTQIYDKASVCSKCGVTTAVTEGNGVFLWGVLGFFIPIISLILFLIWKNDKPRASNFY